MARCASAEAATRAVRRGPLRYVLKRQPRTKRRGLLGFSGRCRGSPARMKQAPCCLQQRMRPRPAREGPPPPPPPPAPPRGRRTPQGGCGTRCARPTPTHAAGSSACARALQCAGPRLRRQAQSAPRAPHLDQQRRRPGRAPGPSGVARHLAAPDQALQLAAALQRAQACARRNEGWLACEMWLKPAVPLPTPNHQPILTQTQFSGPGLATVTAFLLLHAPCNALGCNAQPRAQLANGVAAQQSLQMMTSSATQQAATPPLHTRHDGRLCCSSHRCAASSVPGLSGCRAARGPASARRACWARRR